MYSLKDKEGTIINNVRADFFNNYDTRKLIGNIDFSVAIQKNGKELFSEIEYLLWAEAKQGNKHNIYDAFVQLIFTIGKERTIDHNLPPKFLGVFDAEKIAFIPYGAVMAVFAQHDFNWNVAPSDHESKEFKQLKEIVRQQLDETGKEKDNVFVFYFGNDDRELRKFIQRNFVSGRDNVQRMRINHNNFTHIYEKWRKEVMKTIDVDWESAKKNGLLDHDFYLADLISDGNKTLKQGLKVLLKSDHYDLKERFSDNSLYRNGVFEIGFTDNMKAHTIFWSKYARPPKEEYWNKIIDRKDLLVPQNIREIKGSYYTPAIWVEKSQEYLAQVLGEDWQDEYYIWDCCAGTGNLLRGLRNKYNIWASELFDSNVRVIHDIIDERESKGQDGWLIKDHVFKFDFLNDDFSQLPQGLQDIINDPEKRKKLVIYINPPYAEATTATTVTGTGKNKEKVATESLMYSKYKKVIGKAIVELFAQFFVRIYEEIPGATLAEFSTLKILQASNFADFRKMFKCKLESAFIVPAKTFDNVSGSFPIGFFIWKYVGNSFSDDKIDSYAPLDIYDSKGEYLGQKNIAKFDSSQKNINRWIKDLDKATNDIIGYIGNPAPDFQHNSQMYISRIAGSEHINFFKIAKETLIPAAIYSSVRQCIDATWLNDRDQFLYPNDNWRYDKDFQYDCIAYTLFHGQNRITASHGTNHWIPFAEREVKAPDNIQSHFMSDFIKGKLAPKAVNTLFGAEESLIPTEPIVFTPAAAAVMEAGRKIWEYYLTYKPKTYGASRPNVNASFYDIRAYFQGRDEKGKMNKDSKDEHYNELLRDLRHYQKVLAKQIEKKVYLYGFLKGEVTYTQEELTAKLLEAEKENAALKQKLQAQQSAQGLKVIGGNVTYIDNSTNYTIKK